MRESEKINTLIARLLNTKEGEVLRKELEYYVTMPLMDHDSPQNTAYQIGKRDLAMYLLTLAEQTED